MKDFLDQTIEEGAEIVYARRQSSDLWLTKGTVLSVGAHADGVPFVRVDAGLSRPVTLGNGRYIVVTKAPERSVAVNPNQGKTMIDRFDKEHPWTEECKLYLCRPVTTQAMVESPTPRVLAAGGLVQGFNNDEAFQMGRRAGITEGYANGVKQGQQSVLMEFAAFLDRSR